MLRVGLFVGVDGPHWGSPIQVLTIMYRACNVASVVCELLCQEIEDAAHPNT